MRPGPKRTLEEPKRPFVANWEYLLDEAIYTAPVTVNWSGAALLNRDYIPVKVDREINSGLDDALQNFSAQLSGASGWPLNAFVTPEGYPVFVILYAPPDDFRKQLNHLTKRWVADRAGIQIVYSPRPRRGAPCTSGFAGF